MTTSQSPVHQLPPVQRAVRDHRHGVVHLIFDDHAARAVCAELVLDQVVDRHDMHRVREVERGPERVHRQGACFSMLTTIRPDERAWIASPA